MKVFYDPESSPPLIFVRVTEKEALRLIHSLAAQIVSQNPNDHDRLEDSSGLTIAVTPRSCKYE